LMPGPSVTGSSMATVSPKYAPFRDLCGGPAFRMRWMALCSGPPMMSCMYSRRCTVGVNLVPKGGTNTTVLFSSEGAENQRAPSEDYTFFHFC
jgi:hypothetical protein